MDYLKNKLDTEEEDQFAEVARLLIDMIKVSYRFDNDLCEGRGIGKILDLVNDSLIVMELLLKVHFLL